MVRAGLRSIGPRLRQLRFETAAQDLIEYGVLIALLATTVLFALSGLGVKVPGFYAATAAALPGDAPVGESPDPGVLGNPGNDKPVGGAGDDPSGKGK